MFRFTRAIASRRYLSATSKRSNLVSDLYIQQIKSFKPTPLSASEIETSVKKFQLPSKPSIPADEVSADALAQYQSTEVETETKQEGSVVAAEEDWFVFEDAEEQH